MKNFTVKKEEGYEQLELLEALEKNMGLVPDFSQLFVGPPDIHHARMGIDGAANQHNDSHRPYIELDFHTISLHFAV